MAKANKKKGTMKATGKSPQGRWPLVPFLASDIVRRLREADVSPKELLKGLDEQRAQLFRERYPNCAQSKPKTRKG